MDGMTLRGGAAVVAAAALLVGGAVSAALTQGRSTTEWRSAQPSPTARTEVGAARIGERVYVVGGYTAPSGDVTGAMQRYNISSNRWARSLTLPIAVNHAAVTAAGGILYVHGGFLASGGPTDRLYRYDPRANEWTRLPDAPIARGALALQAIG